MSTDSVSLNVKVVDNKGHGGRSFRTNFKETTMEMAMEIMVILTVVQEEITIKVTTLTGMS